ncbi:single-strand binding protein [Allomeiothermus silvanus DSM 9946]|jgi:single-strand DNA-binding protein|uniref:Single-strand binding protein n=1 Tax=Allomeiothermus silvanus (strain ATCC 700542 / DSM 9946 / NBRC 106475 / NCIMB 13440 / VI-R2) TaxID=526227 RepID=D7BCU9_ALLS1|nr:single-stranded DNA-binding protein [Allomeiothermus silvanus]ADH64682.1 single-strand binding protein [Allomeiothermus silvanus DSM 9946]
MGANLLIVSGALSRHELRYTPKGTPILEVSLVGKRAAGEQQVFFRADLTFYGQLAESWSEQLAEGAAYQASGRLEYESWEGADGKKASRIRIVGDELHRLEEADVHEESKGPVLYGADNRVFLMGGLTTDPEMRQSAMRTPIAKVQLGFSTWDTAQSQAKQHYVELEAWGDAAKRFLPSLRSGKQRHELKKGAQVFIEGALKTEVWEDPETKNRRYKRLVEVYKVTPLVRLVRAAKAV